MLQDGANSSSPAPRLEGPCLKELDLSGNFLDKIELNFFRTFECGSLTSLLMQNANLSSIHEGDMD